MGIGVFSGEGGNGVGNNHKKKKREKKVQEKERNVVERKKRVCECECRDARKRAAAAHAAKGSKTLMSKDKGEVAFMGKEEKFDEEYEVDVEEDSSIGGAWKKKMMAGVNICACEGEKEVERRAAKLAGRRKTIVDCMSTWRRLGGGSGAAADALEGCKSQLGKGKGNLGFLGFK